MVVVCVAIMLGVDDLSWKSCNLPCMQFLYAEPEQVYECSLQLPCRFTVDLKMHALRVTSDWDFDPGLEKRVSVPGHLVLGVTEHVVEDGKRKRLRMIAQTETSEA